MRRLRSAYWVVIVLALIAVMAAGCWRAPVEEPPAPTPGAGSDAGGGSPGSQPSGTSPAGVPNAPPPSIVVPPQLEDAKITALSPGVQGGGTVTSRDVRLHAQIDCNPASFEPAALTIELNGVPLDAYVLRYQGDEPVAGRVLAGATAAGLLDGQYVAALRVKAKDGRVSGATWRFNVAAAAVSPADGGTALTLYFADSPLAVAGFDGEYHFVTPVRRSVAKTSAPARAALEELIAGPRPEDGEVGRTVPASTRILGLTIRDDVAKVDLSQEFARDVPGGTLGNSIVVQSIVYTLTEFPNVQLVQVFIEGQPWSDGHFEWTEPWPRPGSPVTKTVLPRCE